MHACNCSISSKRMRRSDSFQALIEIQCKLHCTENHGQHDEQ